MSYPTVPFMAEWVNSDKIDAKAVYRRPHRHHITNEIQRDPSGVVLYDYSVLPIRRDNDWCGKGFEYVTIADAESLSMVAGSLRGQGLDPRSFIMDPRTNSPWGPEKYLANAKEDAKVEHDRLREMVEKHGVEATEDILKITLPDELRALAPKASSNAPKSRTGAAA
jgi:hypothetical protein